jgi:adenosylcobinamide-GDP ribazoletransferase
MNELRLFFTALQFFTRVPVPAWVGWSPAQLNASARHFPTVGWLVGVVCGGVLLAGLQLWSAPVAVLLSMAAGVLLTGAFHEDGFADSCDGFGGGHSPEQVLAIMKDSRVGSYATVGVVLVLALKYQLLIALVGQGGLSDGALALLAVLVASHATSRLAALGVMAQLSYVRDDASSKSKPIAQGIGAGPLLFATVVALLPCTLLGWSAVPAVLGAALTSVLAARYFKRRLGGYVGDALGATQQVAELVFLLGLLLKVPAWM